MAKNKDNGQTIDELAERVTRLEKLLLHLHSNEMRQAERSHECRAKCDAARAEEDRLQPIRVGHIQRFVGDRCVIASETYCAHLFTTYREWAEFAEIPETERLSTGEEDLFYQAVCEIEKRVTAEVLQDNRGSRLKGLTGICAQPDYRNRFDRDFPKIDKRYEKPGTPMTHPVGLVTSAH